MKPVFASSVAEPGDYQPKNILVTGGAGFIGSHVVLHLVEKYPDYNVINFDKLDYCSAPFVLDPVRNSKNYKFVKGNILSADLLRLVMKTHNIDTVLHFAAQSHVDNSFGNSFQFTENNMMGTHTLVEVAMAHKVKRFVHISTDEVYGEIPPTSEAAGEETTVLEPTNPYAASKAAAENMATAYYRSFNLPLIVTRGNNVYGPGQYPEKLIPKFICLLERGESLCLHGDGSNRRTFVYVKDAARAFDTILHKGKVGHTYNVGSEMEKSNLEVARDLLRLYGLENEEERFLRFVSDRPFNDMRYCIDSQKLRDMGWEPEMSWEEGLRTTIQWYRQFSHNWPSLSMALVPHPRAGLIPSGRARYTTDEKGVRSRL